jgi:hypothetical protein
MEKKKETTWAEIKAIVNAMSEEALQDAVIIWASDAEKGYTVNEVEILDEDYVFDGEDGCIPISILRSSDDELKDVDLPNEDHPLILKKGRHIIHAD